MRYWGVPRFVDVDPGTLLLDAGHARACMNRNTAAVLPVHLYGNICDLDEFCALARKTQTMLVQDACQAHGAHYRGRPLAAFSLFSAYSFYPTKNLGALGDGGGIVTNRAAVARRVRLLRDGGRRND